MPAETVSEFLDGLTSSRLLDSPQVEELMRRPEPSAGDLSGVGRFLQDRGWLTSFQVQEIRAGRGAGLTFGGYRILEHIAETPGGPVYKAYHPALHLPVVLRQVRPEWLQPADSLTEYLERVQGASLVSHPNLVNVLDAGVVDGVLYVAEEYGDATDLAYFVNEMGALPVPLACEYIRQAALGLQSAHERGIVHGNLHPGVLLLAPILRTPSQSRPGEITVRPAPGASVRVAGTGLTPRRPAAGEMSLGQGANLGEVGYMAPELVMRGGPDARSDLYSLGACFYFLLTARTPFGEGSALEMLLRLQRDEPAPVETLRSDLPGEVAGLVRRLLDKDPWRRPASAAEVASALAPLSLVAEQAPVLAPPVPLASETATQANPLPAIMAEYHAAGQPVAFESEPGGPAHHDGPPFGSYAFPGLGEGATADEALDDPFVAHPDDLAASPDAPPRRAKPKAHSNRTVWIVAGVLLHLTAIALLTGYLLGWFTRSAPTEPEPTPIEKKKKKRSSAPPPMNWASLGIKGADRERRAQLRECPTNAPPMPSKESPIPNDQ